MAGCSLLYPIWLLEQKALCECLGQVAAAGFDGVALAGALMEDPRRPDTLSEREAAAAREALSSLGLKRTLHLFSDSYFAGVTVRTDAVVDRARACIEGCVKALSGPGQPPLIVSLDPICLPPGPTGIVNVGLIVEVLESLVSLAQSYNIRPAVENWPKPEIGSPDALAAVLDSVRGEVGILLDTGHLHIAIHAEWCREASPQGFIRHLPAPVLEVHLHDNHGHSDEHLPPGRGTADLAAMLRALGEGGFDGPVTLEADLLSKNGGGLKEGLATARRLCEAAQN